MGYIWTFDGWRREDLEPQWWRVSSETQKATPARPETKQYLASLHNCAAVVTYIFKDTLTDSRNAYTLKCTI